jgi:chromosome segregation ATPase
MEENKKDHYISVPREKFEAMEKEIEQLRAIDRANTFFVGIHKSDMYRRRYSDLIEDGNLYKTTISFTKSENEQLNSLFNDIRKEIENATKLHNSLTVRLEEKGVEVDRKEEDVKHILAEIVAKESQLNEAIKEFNKKWWTADVKEFKIDQKRLTSEIREYLCALGRNRY